MVAISVVMSVCKEPVANEIYGYKSNPVFDICPDVYQICETEIDIIQKKMK